MAPSDESPDDALHDDLPEELRAAAQALQQAETGRSFIEILSNQLLESFEVYRLAKSTVLLSALLAGLEIGFSYLLIAGAYATFVGALGETHTFRLFGLFYPVGFVLVVLGRSLLFTEQTSLLTLPVLNGNESVRSLLGLWGLVITGNLAGGLVFGLATWFVAPRLGIFSVAEMASIAEHVVGVGPATLFASALLAGWLMGLLSWVLGSATDTTSRIVLVYLITGTIGFLGLHHSIVGNIEVFLGLLASPSITVVDYITFLVLALAGNAAGGALLVALSRYKAFTSNAEGA